MQPTQRPGAPRIRELDPQEMKEILARNHVGRVAYAFQDRVDIAPLHYVYNDGWIYGRTSIGAKLAVIRHNYWVAFEVDEIEEIFRWRSVVVRGGFYLFSEDGTPREQEERARAITLLRKFLPGSLTETDPVPHRDQIFGIAVQEMEGREAVPVPMPEA